MTVIFVDGPRAGETEPSYTAVPSRVIPIYAPTEGASVCADEQVIRKLGVYRRWSQGPVGVWVYVWESETANPPISTDNPVCKGWVESDLEHAAHETVVKLPSLEEITRNHCVTLVARNEDALGK